MFYLSIGSLVAALALLPTVTNFYMVSLMIVVLYQSSVGIAWNLLMGYAGMLSLGNAIFTGVGAYVMAITLIHTSLPWGMVLFLSALTAGAIGALIAWFSISCGLRGPYFTLMTILFLQITRLFAESNDLFGATGGLFVPTSRLNLEPEAIYYLLLMTVVGFLYIQQRLLNSKFGLYVQAMRDEPKAAASVGVPIHACQIKMMAISAMMSGFAGGILCLYYKNLFASHMFNNYTSIEILLPVILGGLGTRFGPLWGALVFVGLSEIIQDGLFSLNLDYSGIKQVIFGGVLFLIMLFCPKGLGSCLATWRSSHVKGA